MSLISVLVLLLLLLLLLLLFLLTRTHTQVFNRNVGTLVSTLVLCPKLVHNLKELQKKHQQSATEEGAYCSPILSPTIVLNVAMLMELTQHPVMGVGCREANQMQVLPLGMFFGGVFFWQPETSTWGNNAAISFAELETIDPPVASWLRAAGEENRAGSVHILFAFLSIPFTVQTHRSL